MEYNFICPACGLEHTDYGRAGDKIGWVCEGCHRPWETYGDKTRQHLFTSPTFLEAIKKKPWYAWIKRKNCIS